MYSQNEEERFILEHCTQPNGAFLDIGAYDGKTFSNTLALVERGWNGVCLEPCPYNFPRLAALHADNPRIITLKFALTEKSGPIVFYSSKGDGIATTSRAHREKWQNNGAKNYEQTEVEGISYADLSRRYFLPEWKFHFVNLDVEGQNWPLLQTIDLDAIGCKVLCVEHDSEDKNIMRHLGPAWRQVYRNNENLIFVRP